MKYLSVMPGLMVGACLVSSCGSGNSSGSGSRLLISRETLAGNTDIYLLSSTGETLQRLTTDFENDEAPRWSPDGSHIAFIRRGETSTARKLFVMNADGSLQRNLLPGELTEADVPHEPDWLDNDTLVYRRGNGAASGLVKHSMASGEVTALTTPGPNSADDKPAISADGTKLAFIRTTYSPDSTANTELYLANADGTNAHSVLTDVVGFAPAWSPDGRKLAFVRMVHQKGGRTGKSLLLMQTVVGHNSLRAVTTLITFLCGRPIAPGLSSPLA